MSHILLRLGRNDIQYRILHNDHVYCRFLTGEVSLEGMVTHNLVDTWTTVGSNQNKTGFTFNALDSELMKRVNLSAKLI